jgi:hypothetical protein
MFQCIFIKKIKKIAKTIRFNVFLLKKKLPKLYVSMYFY